MSEEPEPIPEPVLEAFGLRGARLTPISIGWINRTFLVERGGSRAVLQRLHPVFRGEVNVDIDACTRHLAAAGVPTPVVMPAVDGRLWVEAQDGPWRLLSYVEGETLHALPSLAHARAAGAFAARFHHALDGLEHEFVFTRPGAHDTPAHLAKLRRLRATGGRFDERDQADAISDAILEAAAELPPVDPGPTRVIHGDLKVTNFRFAPGPSVVALVDLDTLARGSLAIDLGDALRSWCNRTDEADVDARFDADVFGAAMEGYLAEARGWIAAEERDAIVPALETICVELASRFAADLYEDAYFRHDPSRFETRRAHNLARARGQLGLGLDVRRQRASLVARLTE